MESSSSRHWSRVLGAALLASLALNAWLLGSDRDPQEVVDDFHRLSYDTKTAWVENKWLGVTTLQNPNDAWIIQEILAEVRPDFVVETGTWNGGGALLWASVLEQINPEGRVITIDVEDGTGDAQKVPIWGRRVTFLHGSSTDPGIVRNVKQMVGNGKVLVILDSDHSKDNVLKELEAYGPLVSRAWCLASWGTLQSRPSTRIVATKMSSNLKTAPGGRFFTNRPVVATMVPSLN